jgi:outer membrane receptor protein involved in Fe transport
MDMDWLSYCQDARRSGYDYLRVDGSVIRQTRFAGSGSLRNSSREFSSYVQDSWRLTPSFLIELGLRQDWDTLVSSIAVAPRVGIAWGVR